MNIWISFIWIFSYWFLGFINLYNNYWFTLELEEFFTLRSKEDVLRFWNIQNDIYGNLYFNLEKVIINNFAINILKTEDKNFKILVNTKIFTSDEKKAKQIEWNLNNLELSEQDSRIQLTLKNWEIFKEKMNFVPVYRKITIFAPENEIIRW